MRHWWRKKSIRCQPLFVIIACTLTNGWLSPCQSAEPDLKSASALEILADEQFAAHDVDCLDNYRDAVYSFRKIGAKSSDRLRVIEKLCNALRYGSDTNAFQFSYSRKEIIDDVVASGIAPTEAGAKLISVINCSDGFSQACSPQQHLAGWLAVLRQVTQDTSANADDRKKCLEKLVPPMEPIPSALMAFGALKVIEEAPARHSSSTASLRNSLLLNIANIQEDYPDFSVLTPEQIETFHKSKVYAQEHLLQNPQSAESIVAMINEQPQAEKQKVLAIILKQKQAHGSEDYEYERALGWCCDLAGAHEQAPEYYLQALVKFKRMKAESKFVSANLIANECLTQLSLVCSYIADNRLEEARTNLDAAKALLLSLPESQNNGFPTFILPLAGQIAWKAGRLSEAETLLAQADAKFSALPRENELKMFFRNSHAALKSFLPGEESTLSSLVQVLELEHKYPEAEKKRTELEKLREKNQSADALDRYQRLPFFPGCRTPAAAAQAAPAYIRALNTLNQSESGKLEDLAHLAKESVRASFFHTARIFINDGLTRLKNKNDESSNSFKAIFLENQILVDVETGEFERASAEIEKFADYIKPTNKDAKMEILDVKGWKARLLFYEGKYSEAQKILELLRQEWGQAGLEHFQTEHYRDHILDLGRIYLVQKNYKDSEASLRNYLEELGYGTSHSQFVYAQALLARLYSAEGHKGLAQTMISECRNEIERLLPEGNLDAGYALATIGDFFQDHGNNIRAARYHSQAIDMLNYLGLGKAPIAKELARNSLPAAMTRQH